MKIKKLTYYDKANDWKLETTEFSDLTLLVGISGVGKTKILEAIWNLKKIAEGEQVRGAQWELEFSAANGDLYFWQGEFESGPDANPTQSLFVSNKSNILSERLERNGTTIVSRDATAISLKDVKTPKLRPTDSIINLLLGEDDIAPAYLSLRSIIWGADEGLQFPTPHFHSAQDIQNYPEMVKIAPNYETVKNCNLSTYLKASLVFQFVPVIWKPIKDRFVEIFPQVEDIRFTLEKQIESREPDYPLLEIKEWKVTKWIPLSQISAGMYKTFMHICEMFLWPDGTVVLIDEFENSLGVNCLDVLTEDLLQENRRLQFIVTSHHPYIINNISPKYWKIVMRQGGRVFTQDAAALRLDSSSHKAFTQLLNNEHYLEGIIAA